MIETLEKKVYQLVIGRLDGEAISSESYQEKIFALIRKGIGGFIIFGGKKNETKGFIEKIQSISSIPLLIASDTERGAGQQINGTTLFPSQMGIAAAIQREKSEDVLILERAVKAIADEAKDIGINMPLIPVLDVNQNPDNPIICTRAFSDEPEKVAWFGSKYITLLENSGLMSCAKHFPGHGDTSIDSHITLPVINKSVSEFITIDIMPFKEAIRSGVSSIMIGHICIPAINQKPASLSKKIVADILRRQLGFEGLILTDALTMNALKDFKNIYIQCIQAGVDILLHPSDPDSVAEELSIAIREKVITEELIDEAVGRILKAKRKLKRLWKIDIDYQKHTLLSSQLSERSITLLKNTPGILPLVDQSKIIVALAGEEKWVQSSLLKHYFENVSMLSHRSFFEKGGEREFSYEIGVFALFTSIAAWKGNAGINVNEQNEIQRIMRTVKYSLVISFGNPYLLRYFQNAHVLIAAYEATEEAQKAVIRCLRGEIEFQGKLPVKLN